MRALTCALLLLATVSAHAKPWDAFLGRYNLEGTLAAHDCSRSDLAVIPPDVFPQLMIERIRHRRAGGWMTIVPTRDTVLRPFSAFHYDQDVRGRVGWGRWTMKQIDTCVLFDSPPPRRCGVMHSEMTGLPDATGSVPGAVVLEFHDPFRKPDCSIRWEGNWHR